MIYRVRSNNGIIKIVKPIENNIYCYRYHYSLNTNMLKDCSKDSALYSVRKQGYWDNVLYDVKLISVEEMEKLVPIEFQHYFKEYSLPILIKKILKGDVL